VLWLKNKEDHTMMRKRILLPTICIFICILMISTTYSAKCDYTEDADIIDRNPWFTGFIIGKVNFTSVDNRYIYYKIDNVFIIGITVSGHEWFRYWNFEFSRLEHGNIKLNRPFPGIQTKNFICGMALSSIIY